MQIITNIFNIDSNILLMKRQKKTVKSYKKVNQVTGDKRKNPLLYQMLNEIKDI